MTPYGSMPSSSITTRKCWEPDKNVSWAQPDQGVTMKYHDGHSL